MFFGFFYLLLSYWQIVSGFHWQIRKLSLSLPTDTERSIIYLLQRQKIVLWTNLSV